MDKGWPSEKTQATYDVLNTMEARKRRLAASTRTTARGNAQRQAHRSRRVAKRLFGATGRSRIARPVAARGLNVYSMTSGHRASAAAAERLGMPEVSPCVTTLI